MFDKKSIPLMLRYFAYADTAWRGQFFVCESKRNNLWLCFLVGDKNVFFVHIFVFEFYVHSIAKKA